MYTDANKFISDIDRVKLNQPSNNVDPFNPNGPGKNNSEIMG